MRPYQPKRATGRTTRMICEAVQLAHHTGHTVIVVADAQGTIPYLEKLLAQELENVGLNKSEIRRDSNHSFTWQSSIEWYQAGIVFMSSYDTTVRLETLSVMGSHDVVLFDHFALEHQYEKMLAMLHRWDEE